MDKTILTPQGLIFRKRKITFMNLSDVYEHLGFTEDEEEAVADYGFSDVSFGPGSITLLGNNFALDCIVEGIKAYYEELNSQDPDSPSRAIPAHLYTEREIRTKFWEVVEEGDYINVGG